MKRIIAYTEAVVADGAGAATVYFGSRIHGRIHAIKYVPGTLNTNSDVTFTGEKTGVPILIKADCGTSTLWWYPRVIPNKNTDGSAFSDQGADIFLVNERVKLVLVQGGALGAGSVTVYAEEDQ
jgi:hypothetical protein